MFVSFTNYSFNLLLPPCCPLTYPGAHALLSISSAPTLYQLDKLTVSHAASQWEAVAPHLVVESCGVCNIIGSGHPEEASREALSRWLKGESDTDIAEKTRCSVLEAQEASGDIPLAEQLKLFEESSGEPVTGLASPPGMCVWGEGGVRGQSVCILFAISIHWTIVNALQWLFLYFHLQVYSELYRRLLITTCVQIFSRGNVT